MDTDECSAQNKIYTAYYSICYDFCDAESK